MATMSEHEVGKLYYLRTGQKVELVAITTEGQFLVSQILEIETYDGTEYAQGTPAFVHEIFATPPREVVDADIVRLTEESIKLEARNASLRSGILTAERDSRDRFKKLEKYRGLERIEAFIDGTITHVVIEEYDGIKVGPISLLEEKTDSNYRKPEGIRLISLFGKTGGSLEWKVNEYRDGSGSSWRTIVPASSQEEGEEIRRQMVAKEAEAAWAAYDPTSGRDHYLMQAVTRARQFGVPVPPDMEATYERVKLAGDKKTADNLRKEIAERQDKLAKLPDFTGLDAALDELRKPVDEVRE